MNSPTALASGRFCSDMLDLHTLLGASTMQHAPHSLPTLELSAPNHQSPASPKSATRRTCYDLGKLNPLMQDTPVLEDKATQCPHDY